MYPSKIYFCLLLFCCYFNLASGQNNLTCIEITQQITQCNEKDTSDSMDAIFFFELAVSGGDSKWSLLLNETKYVGFYDSTYSFGPFFIADGPLFLTVNDSLDNTCWGATTVFPPLDCQACLDQQINYCEGDTVVLTIPSGYVDKSSAIESFQWYRNNQSIKGATDSLLLVAQKGTYSVEAIFKGGNCPIESCCHFNVYQNNKPQATNDLFNSCPGFSLEKTVAYNDNNLSTPIFRIINNPLNGLIDFKSTGSFAYTPATNSCITEQFSYEVCNNGEKTCCDTAIVFLYFGDLTAPSLLNVPPDITISCDETIPYPAIISTYDECPNIQVEIQEINNQGTDDCQINTYEFRRIWAVKDGCNNTTVDTQLITIEDNTAPDIFKIYTLPNGKKIAAGVMENVNQNWKTISLPIDFPTTPLIFTQVITATDQSAVTARIQNVSPSQFELKLQEEEGADDKHLRESVAWIAIEAGSQTIDFPLETKRISLTNAWETVNFQGNYTVLPSFFGEIQTISDQDPAALRFQNPSINNVQLQIEEETSISNDVFHSSEEVAFLGIAHGIDLTDKNGAVFGETGSVSVDEKWVKLNTNHTYFNPVVILGTPQHMGDSPGVASVRNITPNSFEIRFQEWDYLGGDHPLELISYLVIEGSLPLVTADLCGRDSSILTIGNEIVALDNCDANVNLQYEENIVNEDNILNIIRTWYAVDDCGNATGYSQVIPCEGLGLQLKVMLQGALIGSNPSHLMRDDLRKKRLIPLEEPYSKMENFTPIEGGEVCAPKILKITGEKAIVDWVFIELIQAENQKIVATKSALLQRDGQVVTVDGDSVLYFNNLPIDYYYVSVRHRNHLKAKTLHPYFLTYKNIPFIDFTDYFLPTVGLEPFIKEDVGNALWSGDLNQSGNVIFQGPENDIFSMFLEVLSDTLNANYLVNFINAGYTINDFNLDGKTIYQGPNNDRASLLFNTVLKHPNNAIKAANFILSTKDRVELVDFANCSQDKSLPSCDFDNDGRLNRIDLDDDNDGVVDSTDAGPYNPNSDSDGDGIQDIVETQQQTDPLNACSPYPDHEACQGQDLDADGKFGNFPLNHSLYDRNDQNACIPATGMVNCRCIDTNNDGYILVCHITKSGLKQTLKIPLEQWLMRQAIGDACGSCQD